MLQMVSASGDGVVKVWDTHMFACVQAFTVFDNPHLSLFDGRGKGGAAQKNSIITDLAYSSQCQRLCVAAKGALMLYDVQRQVSFT